MSTWFCQYSKDGRLLLHTTLKAVDREDALYQLENDYDIYPQDILDLYEEHD